MLLINHYFLEIQESCFYLHENSIHEKFYTMTTICLRVQLISFALRWSDCWLWNACLVLNCCSKLQEIGRNWNPLFLYLPIQSIPMVLNGWHVQWVCWPHKHWDVSFQELDIDPCSMRALSSLNVRLWSWMNDKILKSIVVPQYRSRCRPNNNQKVAGLISRAEAPKL